MKHLKQLLSTVLVLVLFVQLLPAQIFAADTVAVGTEALLPSEEGSVAAEREATTAEALSSTAILFEETELRNESTKHFRLENGQFLAIAYDTPVHYLDAEGQWQDYDSSLIPVQRDGKITAYRVQNGDSLRLFAANTADDQLVAVQKGEYRLVLTPVQQAASASTEPEKASASMATETELSSAEARVLTVAAPAEEEIDDRSFPRFSRASSIPRWSILMR